MAKKVVKNISKKDLIEGLAAAQQMTKKDAEACVTYVFNEMSDALKSGGTVDIHGFGKFEVKKRAARTGINPQTKEKIKIKATKAPAFKASKTLKDLVK